LPAFENIVFNSKAIRVFSISVVLDQVSAVEPEGLSQEIALLKVPSLPTLNSFLP